MEATQTAEDLGIESQPAGEPVSRASVAARSLSYSVLTRELLWLAAPMVGVTLSRLLMSFIDFVMVSHLGTAAQAAISPCTLLLFIIACTGMGIGQAVQALAAQSEGRGEPWRGGTYLWQSLYIALGAAIVTIPVALYVPEWFGVLVGGPGKHPAGVQEMEIRFLQYALWSIGPMVACAGLECFWNGIKRPIVDLVAIGISLVTLVITNYLLIFGKFGFPEMGIAGSGVATLLAWCVRMVVLAIPLFWPAFVGKYGVWHTPAGQGRQDAPYHFRGREMRELVMLGGPVSFQWLVDIGAWFVFMQFLMPRFGESAMAAANMVIQFMHLSFMPCLGIGMALTTQVGNAVGAQDSDLALIRVRVARRLVLAYMTLMMVLFITAGGQMASWLSWEHNADLRADVLRLAAQMAIWAGIFQAFDGLCIIYSFASRGAGDTRVPALLFAICCWGIFVLGGYAMIQIWPASGIHGLWLMCTAYIIVLGLLLMRRFHAQKWRNINIFSGQAAVAH